MKKASLTFLFAATMLCAYSQNDTANSINRKYQREIDVDMPFFGKNGITFVYKKTKRADLNSATNSRFQIGLNGNIPVYETSKIDTTGIYTEVKNRRNYNVLVMYGKEKVKFYGKFNFYYGCDVGLFYNNLRQGYSIFADTMSYNQGLYGGNKYVTQRAGISLVPFVGAKYRFSEHFSASIESAFFVNFYTSITKNTPLSPKGKSMTTTQTETGVDFSPSYLRLLSLNYHF